jgi:hypothetical protein
MSAVPFADEVSATRFLMRPLNIWSRSEEEIGRLMSHFAHTPFELDGVRFGTVEAFYTWLLVGDEATKADVAPLSGPRAKYAHAFVATLPRPIVHVLPGKEHDPHEAFCTIMTEIRDEFAARLAAKAR